MKILFSGPGLIQTPREKWEDSQVIRCSFVAFYVKWMYSFFDVYFKEWIYFDMKELRLKKVF